MTGLDVSRTFVDIATANAKAAGVSVDFRLGNASAMPFPTDSFDFIVCQAAFKNFSEPVLRLEEMYRVLRPGVKAMILDLRADASAAEIDTEVRKMGLGWLNSFLIELSLAGCENAPMAREQFQQMASQTPFTAREIADVPLGFAVSLKK